MNQLAGRVGDEFPPPPDGIHELWAQWITRGWFDWESDGWPYWSHLYHVQSWWDFRHLPNILFLHFSDMVADLGREVRRIAQFLDIGVSDERLAEVVEATTFGQMKKSAEQYAPGGGEFWKGGAETFLHRGTNDRWRDVLSDEELALYDAACERTLDSACRKWLEQGGPVATE